MNRLSGLTSTSILPKAVIVCIFVLSAMLGIWFSQFAWGLRQLFIVVMAVVTVLIVSTSSEKVLLWGYYLCIVAFGLGYRAVWLNPLVGFIVPEAMIWVLFIILLARRIVHRQPIHRLVPLPIVLLLCLGAFGVITAAIHGRSWETIASEFKLLLVLMPILYATAELVTDLERWGQCLWLLVITSFYVASLGLTEYFAPSLVAPLQGFFEQKHIIYSAQSFARAEFSFVVSSFASTFLALAALLALNLAIKARAMGRKAFAFACFVLCNLGVYVSGYRGMWLALATALLAYVLVSWRRGWLLLGPYAVVLHFLPEETYHHIYAVFDPVQYYDSSMLDRQQRFRFALERIRRSPLWGQGWGGVGSSHSDFTQIAGNLGIPALLVFLWWYFGLMRKLYGLARESGPWSEYAKGLLATLAGGVILLATEGLIVVGAVIIPFWFIMALAGRLVALAESAPAESDYHFSLAPPGSGSIESKSPVHPPRAP
jgi:O-antigen ligase